MSRLFKRWQSLIMILNSKQIDLLGQSKVSAFLELCHDFVKENFPVYYSKNGTEFVNKKVKEVFLFAEKHAVVLGINIQRLLHYEIERTFLDNPVKVLSILSQPRKNEDEKLNAIFFELYSKRSGLREIKLPAPYDSIYS